MDHYPTIFTFACSRGGHLVAVQWFREEAERDMALMCYRPQPSDVISAFEVALPPGHLPEPNVVSQYVYHAAIAGTYTPTMRYTVPPKQASKPAGSYAARMEGADSQWGLA